MGAASKIVTGADLEPLPFLFSWLAWSDGPTPMNGLPPTLMNGLPTPWAVRRHAGGAAWLTQPYLHLRERNVVDCVCLIGHT